GSQVSPVTRHRYDCRVRFSDVDVYGHVNNVKYFEYYQEARLAYLTSLGRDADEGQLGVVVAKVDVDYKRPILFRTEPYVIDTWITRVGNSSFGLAAEIRDGDRVLSKAEAVLVTFDLGTQQARPLSDRERARLLAALELAALE
ncbi:MAG: acyl-CoA thioesterase, partial [Nocardioidaceae bacterium]